MLNSSHLTDNENQPNIAIKQEIMSLEDEATTYSSSDLIGECGHHVQNSKLKALEVIRKNSNTHNLNLATSAKIKEDNCNESNDEEYVLEVLSHFFQEVTMTKAKATMRKSIHGNPKPS